MKKYNMILTERLGKNQHYHLEKYLSGQRLALRNQRFPVRVRLLVIARLMSKCEAGGSGSEELKKCPPPSPAVLRFVSVRERKPRQKTKKKKKKKKEILPSNRKQIIEQAKYTNKLNIQLWKNKFIVLRS